MIEVQIELWDDGPNWERCCFCYICTRYWAIAVDVPVCKRCASERNERELPTKESWWESVKKGTRQC